MTDKSVHEWERAYDILAERLREAEKSLMVTDEMVERAWSVWWSAPQDSPEVMRRALLAALSPDHSDA